MADTQAGMEYEARRGLVFSVACGDPGCTGRGLHCAVLLFWADIHLTRPVRRHGGRFLDKPVAGGGLTPQPTAGLGW